MTDEPDGTKPAASAGEELAFFRDIGVTEVFVPKPVAGGAPALVPGSMRDLPSLEKFLAGCQRCKLGGTRTNIVFGQGNPKADLVFVGEAPGRDEDEQGLAFVGRAGQLLTKIIEAIGRTRDDVFILNVLKCLRYNAQVQLGDGSWERIGRLVRRRYSGDVLSVDAAGRIVPRRVIGWHTSPLGNRRVFRLSYRHARRVAARGVVGIQLTEDHPVLTDRGYVEAGSLRSGDRVATGQGMSPVARDVAWGTLLGDGHLSARSSYLSFSHSHAQKDYAFFKADLLEEFRTQRSSLAVTAVVGSARTYPIVQVRTLAHRALRLLRSEFYAPTKRVPPTILGRLNDRMLAIWFMDDGYTRIRAGRKPLSEIATCGFGDEDLRLLLTELSRLGLQAKSLRGRIFFDSNVTRTLSERIAPFVPPVMRYKLHPEVADRIPFEPTRFPVEAPEVLYQEVEIEQITQESSDRTFFCIDVEGTHNFVTAGGVVHNCRPPNNRNPEPDEVASCRPFLEEQLRLIEPRAIVTLGTFAAQALLETDEPISRMRGHWRTVRGVRVMPTFHPAFLLRSPDRKKDVWEDMKLVRDYLATPKA